MKMKVDINNSFDMINSIVCLYVCLLNWISCNVLICKNERFEIFLTNRYWTEFVWWNSLEIYAWQKYTIHKLMKKYKSKCAMRRLKNEWITDEILIISNDNNKNKNILEHQKLVARVKSPVFEIYHFIT